MSSLEGPFDVESSGSGPMSSRPGLGWCRVVQARVDFGVRLGWVGLGPVRAKLVYVHIKMDLM